jgi:hypothetical protein
MSPASRRCGPAPRLAAKLAEIQLVCEIDGVLADAHASSDGIDCDVDSVLADIQLHVVLADAGVSSDRVDDSFASCIFAGKGNR